MANLKINDLPSAASVDDTMQLETDIGGLTPNKITAAQVKSYVKSGLDHGDDLDGLADDDHTQYSLADGTRWTTTQTASRAVVTDGSGNLVVSAVTATELGYVDGVTSAIQTQLDTKYDNDNDIDHGGINGLSDDDHTQYALADGTRWTTTNTANRVPISDGSGNLVVSSVTDTELGYVSGVTSAIQTQIDTKFDTSSDVDHDQTTNFVSNEHIDHTSVTLTAGSGLSGGGDISANRSFSVDINGLTADASPDVNNDSVMTYDASAGGLKKVLLSNLPSGGSSTFTGLSDTPSSYSSQANKLVSVNSGETALEFTDAPVGIDSGSTLPSSPATGELFLHTPTGRNWLMQYNGSNWVAIRSLGNTTIYVEVDSTGSQDWDDGYSTGTAWSFEWISTKLPKIAIGHITIECAAGDYTGDTISLGGVNVAPYKLVVNGEISSLYTVAYSSIDANRHVVTLASDVSSAAFLTDFVRLYPTATLTTGTDTDNYIRTVFPIRDSSGSTITLPGMDNQFFNSYSGNVEIYSLSCTFSTSMDINNQSNLVLRNIKIQGSTPDWNLKFCPGLIMSGCYIDITATYVYFFSPPSPSTIMLGCLFYSSNGSGTWDTLQFEQGRHSVRGCMIYNPGGSCIKSNSGDRSEILYSGLKTDAASHGSYAYYGGLKFENFSSFQQNYAEGSSGWSVGYAQYQSDMYGATNNVTKTGFSNGGTADSSTYSTATN